MTQTLTTHPDKGTRVVVAPHGPGTVDTTLRPSVPGDHDLSPATVVLLDTGDLVLVPLTKVTLA